MAKEEPILQIQQDVIETLCKDAKAFLDSDKTKTFEDGVSFGYNMAMKLCVNEISRLRNELAKAVKQLGGFYNPATSVKIPESFGKPRQFLHCRLCAWLGITPVMGRCLQFC